MTSNRSSISVIILLLTLAFPLTAGAGDHSVSGYTAGEVRLFTENPEFSDQKDDPQVSWVLAPEFGYRSAGRAHRFRLSPYLRIDSMDADRTHADLREAYWRYNTRAWEVLVGLNKVFWGVAESNHLVDIINQTDAVEDVDREDKLGQPMVMLGTQRDWGEVQFFWMPYFRERTFPGREGRPRTPLPVDDNGQYESGAEEFHTDLALRYAHYIGDWDFGVYYFYGTSREPRLLLNGRGNALIAFYDVIQQGGLDLQYTREAWLWKFEGIVREGQGRTFAALVGGFEYTFYQLFGTPADLGVLSEYNWDGRDESKAPPSTFDNDLFWGARLALNDAQDTEALVGGTLDLDNSAAFLSVEADRRIGDAFVVELEARFFMNSDADDPEKAFEKDDFINISFQYHF